MTPGEDTALARNQTAQLLRLPEAFYLTTGWAPIATASLAKGVPLGPAVAKLINAGDHKATRGLKIILRVAIVSPAKAIGAILETPWNCDGEEGPPVIHHLQPKVSLYNDVEAKGEYVDLPLAQLQRQVKALLVDLQKDARNVSERGQLKEARFEERPADLGNPGLNPHST